MSWLTSIAKKVKKAAKKLTLKKHGLGLVGLGAASLIPGVGGLLGKVLGTQGSGFMGGLFTKEGFKNAIVHQGRRALKQKMGGVDVGGMLGLGINQDYQQMNPLINQFPNQIPSNYQIQNLGETPQDYQFVNPQFKQFNTQAYLPEELSQRGMI